MTIKDDNLRAIDHHYLTARERRAQRFLATASPTARARTLESHLLREPSQRAQGLRDDVDCLLRYYSVLELASITGAIPELPIATREIALRNLNDEYLRRYYERYYPQLLPQLLRARVSGDKVLGVDEDCTEDFLRFVTLDASRDDDDLETFLGFLDDYAYVIDEETHDLSSVVRTIAHPKRFLAALSVDDEDRTPTDEGVVGFLRFLSFSRDLEHLLRQVDSPLVRSCIWHYYGYWYQELGGQVLGALLTGIHILGGYVPRSATNAAEERALARTHADMAAAAASLQRLTSSVYRVHLEEEIDGVLYLRIMEDADAGSAEARAEPAEANERAQAQKVPVAEREKVYNEFKDKMGELEHGYVKRLERGDMIVDLNGKTEGIIPRHHQSRAERYSQGDPIKAVIVDVHMQAKGPQVVLSRTDPRLLIKLFEMEVPEIYDGTVVIKGAVREPGERAKIAVMSRERDIDPVGACVGKKGSRVQSIIRELGGEKIDIIPWHEDIVNYAQTALAPAKINRVSVTSDEQADRPHLDVIVDNDQLSPAIGKRGLNVRLAAELIGAKIAIKSEEEVKGEVADALAAMLQEAMAESRSQTTVGEIENMPNEWAQLLEDAGYDDLDSLINASVEDLITIEGVDEDMAVQMIERARKHEQVEETGLDEETEDTAEAASEQFEEQEVDNEA